MQTAGFPTTTSGFELHTFLAITQGPSQVAMRVMGAIAAAQLATAAGCRCPLARAHLQAASCMPDQKCSMRRQHSAPLDTERVGMCIAGIAMADDSLSGGSAVGGLSTTTKPEGLGAKIEASDITKESTDDVRGFPLC